MGGSVSAITRSNAAQCECGAFLIVVTILLGYVTSRSDVNVNQESRLDPVTLARPHNYPRSTANSCTRRGQVSTPSASSNLSEEKEILSCPLSSDPAPLPRLKKSVSNCVKLSWLIHSGAYTPDHPDRHRSLLATHSAYAWCQFGAQE